MTQIQFKAKVQKCYFSDGTFYEYLPVPEFDRKHCDMAAFRSHPKFGGFANSDLFKGMLRHVRRDLFGNSSTLKLNDIPQGVKVDTSGFLAVVTVEV